MQDRARWLPRRELGRLIASGVITDGFTLSAYGAWRAWQEIAGA